MHHTISELLGVARINSLYGAAAPGADKKAQRKEPGWDHTKSAGDFQEKEFPGHEVNMDRPTHLHNPTDAQDQYNFLKMAAGGPAAGFVTKTPKSHKIARALARSGHLEHQQEQKLGNNHEIHSWRLTQKGVAATAPAAGGNRGRR